MGSKFIFIFSILFTTSVSDKQNPDKSDLIKKLILFDSTRDGNQEIYMMNPDGSDQRRLTFSSGQNVGCALPVWSPDRKRIAFSSNKDGNWEIFSMDISGQMVGQVTHSDDCINFNADWSPDGSTILFDSNRSGNWEIYSIHPDGSELKRITWTRNGKNSGNPEWSPDGKKILFQSDGERRATNFDEMDIYVMNSDGTGIQRLTISDSTRSSWTPIWSPDGNKIIFCSNKDGKSNADFESEIYIMNSDGSVVYRITENDHDDLRPHWSPDGQMIVYHAPNNSKAIEDVQDWEIYIMKPDGSGTKRLTTNSSSDGHPNW